MIEPRLINGFNSSDRNKEKPLSSISTDAFTSSLILSNKLTFRERNLDARQASTANAVSATQALFSAFQRLL